jgi:hypothetical protein
MLLVVEGESVSPITRKVVNFRRLMDELKNSKVTL